MPGGFPLTTWCENARSILVHGFHDDDGGVVFFGLPFDTSWGLSDKVLLEVTLNAKEEMLDKYKNVSYDTDGDNYCQVMYKIPAALVNAHQSAIRSVPAAEYSPCANDEP